MKLWIFLSSALILYFTYGFYISQDDPNVVPGRLKRETPHGLYDYKGVINVHTDLSIGSSSPQQVIEAAKAAGLDFIMLTDLNLFRSLGNLENYHGNTLVMVGSKYSYLDSRLIHYSPKRNVIGENLGEVQVRLADLLSQPVEANADDLLILAHPYKAGFSWSGEFPSGLDGFELLNAKSLSIRSWETSKPSTIWSLLTYPFNPPLAFLRLFSEPSEEIELFDRLGRERPVVAFAGAEASARAIAITDYLIKFPSYQRSFDFLTNHVLLSSELTGNPNTDKLKIFSALKKGQFYLCVELLGDPKGFFAAIEEHGRFHLPGSKIKLTRDMALKIQLPVRPTSFFEVVVYKDGARYKTFNDDNVELRLTEAGTYRVQVRVSPYLPLPDAKRWMTWIYTNNFRVSP
ncbi:MAG: hypothetical protein KF802_09815 [Bdellovibrionaceae bacterium]|nr:hypothetical protein [Pseudobdellovibrionaceae bacterium]MBX3033585.1 hypothetical protein [Pseudobdellovibrionaceae bacterium]